MDPQTQWWESFFTDLYLDVQSAMPPEAAKHEADFIERTLRLRAPAALLDVPCGQGRHSIELAARGYTPTAVDLNAAAVDRGRRQAEQRGVAVEWHCRDMRDLPWPERFDGAYCFFGSFGYFDDAGNQAFLDAVFAALRPGARFLLETHVAETILTRFQPQGWTRIGERLLLEARRYDHLTGRIETNWVLSGAGRIVEKFSSIRLYQYVELCAMLQRAGFSGIEAYDTTTQLPFQWGGGRLTLAALKA